MNIEYCIILHVFFIMVFLIDVSEREIKPITRLNSIYLIKPHVDC